MKYFCFLAAYSSANIGTPDIPVTAQSDSITFLCAIFFGSAACSGSVTVL